MHITRTLDNYPRLFVDTKTNGVHSVSNDVTGSFPNLDSIKNIGPALAIQGLFQCTLCLSRRTCLQQTGCPGCWNVSVIRGLPRNDSYDFDSRYVTFCFNILTHKRILLFDSPPNLNMEYSLNSNALDIQDLNQ